MTIDAIYTAESTATGGGRDGHVKSSDGKLNLDTRPPKEMGGSGEGVNPELLFSAGYAACFLGALRLVAKNSGVTLDDATAVTVRVGIGKDDTSYGLTSEIIGYLPGLEKAQAEGLMTQANQVCPYSKATRGNVEATLATMV
jgi:Ohr subfamily peroxiredoxin